MRFSRDQDGTLRPSGVTFNTAMEAAPWPVALLLLQEHPAPDRSWAVPFPVWEVFGFLNQIAKKARNEDLFGIARNIC